MIRNLRRVSLVGALLVVLAGLACGRYGPPQRIMATPAAPASPAAAPPPAAAGSPIPPSEAPPPEPDEED